MIQQLKKTTFITLLSSQNIWNVTLQFLQYGTERKICVILRCTLATRNMWILKKLLLSFIPNSLSYILFEWFAFGTVVAKVQWVNFFLRQCIFCANTVIRRQSDQLSDELVYYLSLLISQKCHCWESESESLATFPLICWHVNWVVRHCRWVINVIDQCNPGYAYLDHANDCYWLWLNVTASC